MREVPFAIIKAARECDSEAVATSLSILEAAYQQPLVYVSA